MRFVYFDEVKFHPPRQSKYIFGALSVAAESIPEIETQLNEVAYDVFATRELRRETEFHAVDMIHGNANFKGRSIDQRLEALERLLEIANQEPVRRIRVTLSPDKMVAPDTAADKAFMFLVERVDRDLGKTKSNGILIGDLDTEYADEGVSNLSRYRHEGTPYAFGQQLNHLIDSVYYIPSHHSRMIQLADAYAYVVQLLESPHDGDSYPKKRIRQFVREKTDLYWANSFKDWPSNDSWARDHRAA